MLYIWENFATRHQFGTLVVSADDLETAKFLGWSALHAAQREKRTKLHRTPEEIVALEPRVVEATALVLVSPE
jgi:hypothetical protein